MSKGRALTQLALDNHISLEHIVSFGNAENDISMLRKTGYSVAVENATDHVKSVAHTICGHHNDDGVAIGLKIIFYNGVKLWKHFVC